MKERVVYQAASASPQTAENGGTASVPAFAADADRPRSKARAQAARVDGMVTGVLDTTSEISASLQRAIKVPVREFSGLVNGFKAGMDVLVGRAKGFGSGKPNEARSRDTEW